MKSRVTFVQLSYVLVGYHTLSLSRSIERKAQSDAQSQVDSTEILVGFVTALLFNVTIALPVLTY